MLVKPNTIERNLIKNLDSSIYTLAYNGFYDDHASLFHVMDLENHCLAESKNDNMHVCTLFYNTNVTPFVVDHYIQQLLQYNDKIEKLAIVGIPVGERPVFRLKLAKEESNHFPYRFFLSVKEAEDWLSIH